MGLWFRLLALLGSARNTRASVEAAREGFNTIKATADGFRTVAFQRIRERASDGEPAAQVELGEYYYDGRFVPQDYVEAFRWFLKAAEQGELKAQLNVGLMLAIGRGAAKDLPEACKWLHLAAEQGDSGAQEMLQKAQKKLSPEDFAEGVRRARAKPPPSSAKPSDPDPFVSPDPPDRGVA